MGREPISRPRDCLNNASDPAECCHYHQQWPRMICVSDLKVFPLAGDCEPHQNDTFASLCCLAAAPNKTHKTICAGCNSKQAQTSVWMGHYCCEKAQSHKQEACGGHAPVGLCSTGARLLLATISIMSLWLRLGKRALVQRIGPFSSRNPTGHLPSLRLV